MERKWDMNPEIRAVLFGVLIAALAGAVVLSLFYSPWRACFWELVGIQLPIEGCRFTTTSV